MKQEGAILAPGLGNPNLGQLSREVGSERMPGGGVCGGTTLTEGKRDSLGTSLLKTLGSTLSPLSLGEQHPFGHKDPTAIVAPGIWVWGLRPKTETVERVLVLHPQLQIMAEPARGGQAEVQAGQEALPFHGQEACSLFSGPT